MVSLHAISVAIALVSAFGVTGLVILFFAAPAIFAVVMRVLEALLGRLVATRPGCVALALLVAVPVAYGIGSNDDALRNEKAQALARAAFASKLATAARIAASNDQQRAAAAEAARAQAEERAHALEAQIPKTACLDAAAAARLRGLWQPAARAPRRAARPAVAPRSIDDLLRRE